jgi:hypothetical protein
LTFLGFFLEWELAVGITANVLYSFLNVSEGFIMNATQKVVEEKREPIAPQVEQRPLVVTGQYLYDTFMQADEQALTRMGVIRQMCDIADAFQLKGACDKMVEMAREKDVESGQPAKVMNGKGKEVANRGPKAAYAMNVRTTIQQVWGAIKYARDEMDSLGFDDKTGYVQAGVMAQRALNTHGINWKNDALPTRADKERKALLRSQKEIQKVFQEVQKETPMEVGESFGEWQARIGELANDRAEEAQREAENKAVSSMLETLEKTFSENQRYTLACEILDRLGLYYGPPDEEQSGEEQPAEGTPTEVVEEHAHDA